MEHFDVFVEKVRDANPIEDVMQESGITLKGHGQLRTASKHDSLKVRTDMGRAFWYSKNWNGDVFAWVMQEKGCEFNEAMEILARRAHIEIPKFSREVNEGEVKKSRATAEIFSVAANVFHRWLLGDDERGVKADEEALTYCRGRGWKDETTKLALTGFSGRKSADQIKDMSGEFQLFGIDLMSPAVVAIMGFDSAAAAAKFDGDVDMWSAKYGLGSEATTAGWTEKNRIHGLMDTPGLIYAHRMRGAVNYLSRRQLPGFDKIKDAGTKTDRDWKSFNPHKILVGPKQVYVNHAHRMDKALCCVEGQGDSKSFGQIGFGAMAFCGLMGDIGNMEPEDAERLRKLAAWINKHPSVYLFLDDDEAGQKAIRHAANLIGMKVQIGHMPRLLPREEASDGEG